MMVEEEKNEPLVESEKDESTVEIENLEKIKETEKLKEDVEKKDQPVEDKKKENPKNKKKIIIALSCVFSLILVTVIIFLVMGSGKREKPVEEETDKLPLPELADGARGELGIDKNINEEVIDQYLNRSDSVYRDMRMLEDPGDYESIGGDSMLSGYIKGFEIIPLPYIMEVSGLPESVGNTYQGRTLFSVTDDGKYIANYEESMSIIEKYFPKDKYIFLMCGGGGYAGMMKNFLVSLGWDTTKIYVIGGYWFYKGENNVEVKKVVDGKTSYDFENVPYIKIDFAKLTKANIELKTSHVNVEKVNLSPQKLSLVVGEKYNLTATILPTNATEKRVIWKTSDESIVTVDSGSLVAQKEGTVSITVKTLDGEFVATTEVTVTKKPVVNYLTLSDISEELKQYNDIEKRIKQDWEEHDKLVLDEDKKIKEEFWDEEGVQTEECQKIDEKYWDMEEQNRTLQRNVIDNLMNNKKTFIVLFEEPACYERDFSPSISTQKILKNNKISHFVVDPSLDSEFEQSKLYFKNHSEAFMVIVKDGKIYAYAKDDATFKKDADLKKWIGKYIEIK